MVWVADYEQDLLADILRFFPQFGTDPLEAMTGPTFFALANRIPVFGGVMAYRLQQPPAPEPAPASNTAGQEATQVVSLDTFRSMHPDLVEVVSVGG